MALCLTTKLEILFLLYHKRLNIESVKNDCHPHQTQSFYIVEVPLCLYAIPRALKVSFLRCMQ